MINYFLQYKDAGEMMGEVSLDFLWCCQFFPKMILEVFARNI